MTRPRTAPERTLIAYANALHAKLSPADKTTRFNRRQVQRAVFFLRQNPSKGGAKVLENAGYRPSR